MTQESYGQFCPVAMVAEILCRRWTLRLRMQAQRQPPWRARSRLQYRSIL
jgi:hypothetical protein